MHSVSASNRKAPRAYRREQLIEATISTVARLGIAQSTLAHVAKAAGVSHGLIIFHFQSKEALFAETLSFMSNEHRGIWTAALAEAGPESGARLHALILAEFDPRNLTRERLAAWCAFWGEALKGPLYLQQCGENDMAHHKAFQDTCDMLAAEGSYGVDPLLSARVLRLTIHGVKLEMAACPVTYGLEQAMRTAFFCAATLFPLHFDENGLIPR
jgi:AcrR family transcriptional regulator